MIGRGWLRSVAASSSRSPVLPVLTEQVEQVVSLVGLSSLLFLCQRLHIRQLLVRIRTRVL